MATLQVRDLDDRLYNFIKTSAKLHNRSISQEVVTIIESFSSWSHRMSKNATIEFLSLTGAWKDERTPENILEEIKESRTSSQRFGDHHGLFD
jgi:plasmid stability protein